MDLQTELYRYLYDLQGYLVIPDVLSPDQVATLNRLIDENADPVPENWRELAARDRLGMYNVWRFGMAGGSYPSGPGFLAWGQPFVDLMDHPLSMQLLRMQLGDCFRLDRIFGMRMREGHPNGRLHSDYGASQPFSDATPGRYYHQPAHQALHGFGVAVFNLSDCGPDTGGLRLIPGSHNSHYRLPQCIRDDEYSEVVISPDAPAGSLTLFTEATTHGTGGWTASYERRSLLYKYCASQLTWSRTRVTAPEGIALTERREKLLREPAGGHWFFESLFRDGEKDAAN